VKLPASVERLRARNPLPDGTVTVGAGLMVNGVMAYAFLGLAGRTLGTEANEPLAVMWAMIYLVGPGFFLPLEQEVSRALANRWAQGLGVGPVVRQAGLLGLGLVGFLAVAIAATSGVLVNRLFDDQWLLVVGFSLAVIGYGAVHLARGMLAGLGRFRGYSIYYMAENTLRFVGCAVLAIVGVATAGPYGLIVGVAPIVAIAIALRGEKGMRSEGPPAPWGELAGALGSLLAASVLTAFLLYAGPVAVELLADESQSGEASRFLAGLTVARVPVFLFQAVQAALLPKLSALAGAGRLVEFRQRLSRLLVAVAVIAVFGVIGAFLLGPTIIRLLFGADFVIGRTDIALLAMSSGAFMLAVALGQALIALSGQSKVAVGWLLGVLTFLGVTAAGNDLLLRVELGLVAGSVMAALVIGVLAWIRLQSQLQAPPHTLSAS
jgi:O-antigen/teichoic acid export membrane protein